jgi:surface polysaccharide O-acyltransferase-like enzyme
MLEQRTVSLEERQPEPKRMNHRSDRLLFIDNTRWFIIILVVLMHLNVTYSNMGLWYYQEPAELGPLSGLLFGMYGSLNQAYFMGLLFLIAGYFVPGSFDKKGANQFILDKMLRLGVPTLIYMLLIHPITMMIYYAFSQSLPHNIGSWYMDYILSFSFLSTSGPLWFTLALLIFTVVYALIRQIGKKSKGGDTNSTPVVLTHKMVLGVIGTISIFAFLTRIFIPAGATLFNNLTGNFMQLGFFPSYIVLFIVGIIAYRKDIPANLSYKFGKFWLKLALFLGIPLWFVMMVGGGDNLVLFFGGLHWQSAAYSAWESFFCVAVSIGLLVLFREKFNRQGQLSSFLSENAFGVYVFHAPIVVAITMSLSNVTITPIVKMYMVALIVLPTCFVFTHLLRRIPVIRRFFS